MNPIETYLQQLRDIHASGAGVPETSYYTPLANLLNEIGRKLQPKVKCIVGLANLGAGQPDVGLFAAHQFKGPSQGVPGQGQMPERGVIEAKPPKNDTAVTVGSAQVSRYLQTYGLVLVTTYREFVLLGKDDAGNPVRLESYCLADNEAEFWSLTLQPRKAAELHGVRLAEYLARAMLHAAPVTRPEDVAWFLASYARDAKARIESVKLPALAAVRGALEEALGLKFEGEKGEHFFRSSLVQTLFYGVFSAWVLWSRENAVTNPSAKFDWKQAAWYLHVPMIRALFEQVAAPTKLESFGLVEPLDWASATLNRVDGTAFFAAFDQRKAVQYFYEPFLQQFDPELRKELGVWFTPREIVEYMVARVDAVLRQELDIPDGLADPRVYVLDPCCGTGTYLVEVLSSIAETLRAKGGDALVAQDIKKAATERVFGFELLPAPFVVSHLQLGLLLQQLQAPLSHSKSERAAIYLTNSLTGWEPPKDPKQHLMFPELEEEREAAEEIKREKPILVILGNPPYNAFAGVSPEEEKGLVEPYKEGLNKPVSTGGWGIKKFNLDDLYVRFFRLAERRIAEKTGRGVVCFISNSSYLDDPSFVVMRQRFLREFTSLWFDNLNGDSRETGKLTPDGQPDPSVFSTKYHPVGIRVGTAIGLMVRRADNAPGGPVRYREYWGVNKRRDLLDSLGVRDLNAQYEPVKPTRENRHSLRPSKTTKAYESWPGLPELCALPPMNGLMEKRGGALFDIDRASLELRIRTYYDVKLGWEDVAQTVGGLAQDAAGFDARKTRAKVISSESYDPDHLRRYVVRPFDHQWAYYSPTPPLWNRHRPDLWAQCWAGNAFLVSRVHAARDPEGPPFYFVRGFFEDHLLIPDASAFPVRVDRVAATGAGGAKLLAGTGGAAKPASNLAAATLSYLRGLGIDNVDDDATAAGLVWMHALAVGFSPAYLVGNRDGIRRDWPHIPLPAQRSQLENSADLGDTLAALLDVESAVEGVTSGSIRAELRTIGAIARNGGGAIDPVAGELDLTAGWGHSGKSRATMPGEGRVVERDYTADELSSLKQGASGIGLTTDQALEQLGRTTLDVFLNDVAFWRNIPANVWGYTIGGYQVIKKWLSYRERTLIGRGLTSEEAREVTDISRRIAAILLVQPRLDLNYEKVKANAFAWRPDA